MRILVTGFTGQQVGRATKTKYDPVIAMLIRAMRELGHTVEQREPLPNDTLEGIDLLMVGLVPPLSIAGHFTYLSLGALSRAWATGVPTALYVDDWRFTQMISQWKTIHGKPDRLFEPVPMQGRHSSEWARGIARKPLEAVCEIMYNATAEKLNNWPPVFVPRFGWGKDGKLAVGHQLPTTRLVHYDPTSFATPYPIDVVPDEARGRRWVLGVLSDQVKWLDDIKPSWGVLHYGNTASKASSAIPENELVSSYGRTWGVLSPRYTKLDGTGWWRNRYVYSARAKCVLLADPREAPQLGEAYAGVLPNLELVEGASLEQLKNLAQAQIDALRAGCWGREQLLTFLSEELAKCVAQ